MCALLPACSYEEGKNLSEPQALLEAADKLGLAQEATSRLGLLKLGPGQAAPAAQGSNEGAGPETQGKAGADADIASCTAGGACAVSEGGAAPGQNDEDSGDGLDGELLRAVQMDDVTAKSRCATAEQSAVQVTCMK